MTSDSLRGASPSADSPNSGVVEPTSSATAGAPKITKWVLMVGAMSALPAISSDIYLPALTKVAEDLNTTDALVQLTMSGTLIGGAFGQLVIGPLSDRFGRRRPALIGIALHVVISLLCAVVPNISGLIGLRVTQGFFNAAAGVVGMAVVRDKFVGSTAARLLSRLMLVIGVAPLLAPTLGTVIDQHFGWQAIFVALALIGALVWALVWWKLPETHPEHRRATGGITSVARVYRSVLRDRKFIVIALLPGLSFGVIMSYVVASPFLLKGEFGISDMQFSVAFAALGMVLVTSAQANAALVRRFEPYAIMRVGIALQLLASAALAAVIFTGFGGLVGAMGALVLVLFTVQLVPPNASAIALSRHGETAGTAAALIGAIQVAVAAATSALVPALGSGGQAMAIVIALCGLLAGLVLVLFLRTAPEMVEQRF